MTAAPRFASVWDAIADTPSQAANLRLRAELAHQVLALVAARGWTQAEAARRAGVTAPRMSDLARGLLDKFSLDALVSMLEGMGASVQIKVKSRSAVRAALVRIVLGHTGGAVRRGEARPGRRRTGGDHAAGNA